MADKKTCSESNALAAALLTMDEEVAQRYVEQIAGMNALEKAGDTAVLNIARAQLNGMINATILKDGAGGIAKKRLVEQMAKSNIGTKKYITDMLNTLDKFKTAVANGDGMQTLYNVLDVSRGEGEAMFGGAIDSLLTHFSNKYALNETYDVLDETLRSIEEGELAKKAEKQLVDTTYDILISKGLVDESNVVDFVEKQEDKIEELKKERKEYIKKNKVKTGETDDYLDEMETKIKRYENIIKKSKDDEIYKKASKRKKESLPSEEATEYTDGMFNETSKDAVVNYKDDSTKRSQRIVEAIKEGHSIPNTDASYIAMREVLGESEAYNNYVVARVLLSEGNDVIENVLQKIGVSQVFGNELTEEVIQNMKNMEDLVNVAFSYTKGLKDTPELLKLFLEKKDLIIGNVDSIEKLGVVNALYNIGYYGENYTTHMKYDIFATRLLGMGYELPKGMTTKSAYQKIGKAIVDNVNFKLGTDGRVQFSEWKKLTLEGKDGQKIVISGDDLRRLMPSFLPANAPFSDFKDVITIAGYDDYLNKLESAVKETKKTAIREYDDIAQRIKGQPEVEEITEESIFDQDKLEALKQMYEKMISDPKADDRSAIFLKAITKQTIDTKKTLLLSSSFDNAADAAENQVKADLYNGLADQNSIPVTTGIKGYKPSDIVTEDLAKNTEFVLIEGGYIDDGMWDFINKVNEIRASNKLAPVTTVKNKMYNKGRFYIKNGELRFSIITSADYNDFVETMLNIGVDYSDLKNPDVPNLLKMYADYVDAAYGGNSPNAQLKKIENLLGLPGKTDSKGRLIIDKEGDIEVDVVALDQYVKDVTSQTGKFKAEVVDLGEKWDNVKNLNEDSIFMIANRFADEVGLPGVKDIKGINMEDAKELLFAAMYNTDVVRSIQAKYAFLKTCGITGVARESDKIAVINYLFNKQLRLSGYNMGVLQSDDFIRKIVNEEDVSDDVRANLFMKANAGNPDFLALAGDTPEEKMANLINNVKETILFDKLKNELSFPSSDVDKKINKMPHEGEQAVYRMLIDPTNGKTDGVLGSLEKMGLYLGMEKEVKNAAAKEMDFVLTAIEEYKKAIQDLVENGGKYDRAIELKQELQFVLSTINNKVILPSYIGLVPEDTLKEIAQLGVSGIPLNISDTQQAIDQFMNSIDNIEKQYKNLSSLVKKSKEEVSKMDNAARQEKMVEEGLVDIVGPDGSLTTLRIDDVVSSYIDYVQKSGLKFSDDVNQLLQINVGDLKYLSNRQKYDVFKKLSLIKKYTDFYSMYKTIYYKQHTLLATSNFFDNYKLGDDGYPQIIQTLKAKIITDANVSDRDIQLMAQNIYDNLMVSSFTEGKSIDGAEKMKFGSNFEPPSQEMVKLAVSEQVDMLGGLTEKQKERIQNYMESIFNPYTELKSIPADCEAMIKKTLGQSLDSISTSLGFTKDQAISEFGDLIISQRDGRPLTVNEMFTMSDSQEMLPSYIRNGNNQKVEISKLTGGEDVKDINKQVNKINDIIIATVNDFNVVTDLDKATAKDSLRGVAGLFRQNTLLNQIARAEDRLYSEGNEISALIKDVVFDKRILGVRKRWLAELFPRIMGGQLRKAYIEETWDGIKAAYNRYFNMSLGDLERMDLNDIADNVEGIGLRLALYFKRLGDMLGSADGVRGVTTDIDINKALYHIGDCVNFVSSSAGVLSLASGMNNFQILKFVKVIKDGEGFHPFLRKISQASSGRGFSKDGEELADETTRALLGTGLEAGDINRFNELFNGNYDVKQAQRIIFALGGFQRDNRWNRYIGRFLQRASKSSFLTRAISSYPFGILPVPLQQIGYSVKRSGLTRGLGVSASDLSEFHLLRKRENVLVGGYFEFTDAFSPKVREQIEEEIRNKFGSIENFLGSIGHQYSQLGDQAIVDNLQKLGGFLKGDDSATMFKKIKAIWQNPEARKLLDNTKENANNIIDGLNSSAMKDIVFAQAIMRNNVYKFYSPEDYYLFMKDPTIDAAFKRKVKDEIIIQANRSFIDTMGLGGGATRAVVARNGFGDAMLQLHNFINFRGQWGTTIARNFVARMKQIFGIGGYIMKNIGKPGLADEISERFIRTPEMQNFLSDIYSVAYRGIHAQREATRNYEDSELQPLSFFDKYNTLSGLAMFMQGLSSGGRGRIVSSGFEGFMRSLGRDLSIGDSLGVAGVEMLESFFSNFGRQFKFEKFVSDGLMVSIEQSGSDEFDIWGYFIEQLGNMSKGSLRYMANESGYNNYSDLPDNTGPRRYVAGTKTNKNNIYLSHRDAYGKVIAIKEGIKRWGDTEDDGIDMTNVISDIMGQGTFWKTCENLYNSALATYYLAKGDAESKAALSKMSKDVAEINEFSTAVEETVQGQQLRDMGYYIPQDAQGVEDLGKKFIRHNAPGGSNSFTRMQKYSMGLELDNVRDDEAFFYETIGQEGAKRIVDKVDDVYHDKNSSAWDKRRAMIDAVAEELERHEDDPLYPELQTFLYKGIMSFQYDWYVDQAYEKYKAERNAGIKKKKDYIAESKTDWLKYEGNEYRLKQEFVLNHNVEWSNVDVLTYKSAAFKEMIRLDEGKFNPFVERKVGKDEEGKDTLEPTIKSKYRINYDDTIKALRLFEAGEGQAAIQQMSLMTKKVDYEDSTGVAGAILLNDQFQLIDEMPNLTRADKAMFKFQLLNNNYDIARKVIENREIFGDDSYIVNLVSEMRYNVDQSLTEAIQEVAQSYETGNDDKSSGGSGATLSKLKASKIALDKLSGSDRGNRGNGGTRGKPSFNYTIDTVHGSEFLRGVNNKKKASTNRNAIDTSIGTYKEIPLVTQPKDLGKPKKIKGEKKKVKNTKKK